VACGTTGPQTDVTSASDGTTEAVEDTTVYEELPDAPADGTLLYYEDFEKVRAVKDKTLISSLGWEMLSKQNRGQTTGTAKYSVEKYGEGKALYIVNNDESITNPETQYLEMLSCDKFGFAQDRDYTIQYDMEYTGSATPKDFFSILTDFNGSYYQSFVMYNGGYGYNQIFLGNRWYSLEKADGAAAYATESSSTSTRSIAYKLLGQYCNNKSVFDNVPVSVRLVHIAQKGVNVYMRVNDTKYENAGQWILVSETASGSKGALYLDHAVGDGAVVLKVGGAQNGYIDNIAIWLGTGDEPAEKDKGILKGAKCHEYVYDENGAKVCMYCGNTPEGKWYLSIAPEYEGGILSSRFEYAGPCAVDSTFPMENESKIQLARETSREEFLAYVSKLDGTEKLTKDFYREEGQNIYASYRSKSGIRVYAYYLGARAEARIIEDGVASKSLKDFGYVYEKKAGDSTVIYQYGLNMTVNPRFPDKTYTGMMYVIKAADNSVMIIDGGSYVHFDSPECDRFLEFLHEITGTKDGEKIRISGWLITHAHQDHMGGFTMFLRKYGSKVDIERIMFSIASVYSSHGLYSHMYYEAGSMFKYIENYANSDYELHKLQTGEKFNIADIEIDVLYSHEDMIEAVNAQATSGEYNNACAVYRITVDGKVFIVTGDINRPAMARMMDNQPAELLKADLIQASHHLYNDLTELYKVAQAPAVFMPTRPNVSTDTSLGKTLTKLFKKYASDDMILFSANGTYGLEVKNGKFQIVYKHEKVYSKGYTGWAW